jgi:hypothetical protein
VTLTPLALARGLADATAEAAALALALGLGDAATDGAGVALGALGLGVEAASGVGLDPAVPSGPRKTIPPSSSAAATIPTTSPARIDRRPITAGAYQYERPTASLEDH